jgi:hypothetical protein
MARSLEKLEILWHRYQHPPFPSTSTLMVHDIIRLMCIGGCALLIGADPMMSLHLLAPMEGGNACLDG